MASKIREKIKLVSTGLTKDGRKTGYFRTTTKNKRTMTEKLRLKCFDPRAWNEAANRHGMHVEFVEDKIK